MGNGSGKPIKVIVEGGGGIHPSMVQQAASGGGAAPAPVASSGLGGGLGAPSPGTRAMGTALLDTPSDNLGSGFTYEERKVKRLQGLLPPHAETAAVKVGRAMDYFRKLTVPLNKYMFLDRVRNNEEQLYFEMLVRYLPEMTPIVYTPTVGEACQHFGSVTFERTGMFFSVTDSGRMRAMLDNWPHQDVEIIVVTDGGRILGLGDLGTNGMGIPIGKCALYVAAGGFDPRKSLPVTLDMGTNNKELLESPYYMGMKNERLKGEDHLAIVEEFCLAVKDKWPNCLIQFEDFQTDAAFNILEKMRKKVLCFNDDIQGTGATVLSGLVNGVRAQGGSLKDVNVVFFGAGSSAVGVATMISLLLEEKGGLSADEARGRIYLVDSKGLVTTTRGDKLAEHKKAFARTDGTPDMKDLAEIIAHAKPNALFGLSGAGPVFMQEHIEEMCKYHEQPLVFPLSNPTSKAEVSAVNAYAWSKGKCLFAAGSPFPPVEYEGKTLTPGQGNNMFIFPGVGFGAMAAQAEYIPDSLFITAADELAHFVTDAEIAQGKLYPDITEMREISAKIATSVASKCYDLGLARLSPKPGSMDNFIRMRMFVPKCSNVVEDSRM